MPTRAGPVPTRAGPALSSVDQALSRAETPPTSCRRPGAADAVPTGVVQRRPGADPALSRCCPGAAPARGRPGPRLPWPRVAAQAAHRRASAGPLRRSADRTRTEWGPSRTPTHRPDRIAGTAWRPPTDRRPHCAHQHVGPDRPGAVRTPARRTQPPQPARVRRSAPANQPARPARPTDHRPTTPAPRLACGVSADRSRGAWHAMSDRAPTVGHAQGPRLHHEEPTCADRRTMRSEMREARLA